MVGFVRAKASIHTYIFDYVVTHEVVKRDIFKFLGHGRTKNCSLLRESR